MDSKYFGIINEQEFLEWDYDKQMEFLILKEYFDSKYFVRIEIEKSETIGELRGQAALTPDNIRTEYYCKKEIAESIYDSTVDFYNPLIGGDVIVFGKEFHIKTRTKSEKKTYKLALKEFYNILDEIDPYANDYVDRTNYKPRNPFEILREKKNNLIALLQHEEEILFPFLTGNKDFFNQENATITIINTIIEFEANLKILTWLNENYLNIKNHALHPDIQILEKLYNDFEGKVKQKAIAFIHSEMQLILQETTIPILMRVLLNTLKQNNLFDLTELKFRTVIENNYNIELKRIKLNFNNETDFERIKDSQNRWDNFTH